MNNYKKLKKIVFYNLAMTVVTIIFLFFVTPIYESKTSLYIIQKNDPNDITSQIKSSILGGNLDSIIFFDLRDVANSIMLREKIAEKAWLTSYGEKVYLSELWNLDQKSITQKLLGSELTEEKVLNRVIKELENRLVYEYTISTGLFNVFAYFEDPLISQMVAKEVKKIIIDYSDFVNQEKAKNELAFFNEKFDEISSELLNSENKLKNFIEENKNYSASPSLLFEKSRLERDVLFNEQSYLTILSKKEESEISAQKNDFIITELDEANYPLSPSFPNAKLILVATLALFNILIIYYFYRKKINILIFGNDT